MKGLLWTGKLWFCIFNEWIFLIANVWCSRLYKHIFSAQRTAHTHGMRVQKKIGMRYVGRSSYIMHVIGEYLLAKWTHQNQNEIIFFLLVRPFARFRFHAQPHVCWKLEHIHAQSQIIRCQRSTGKLVEWIFFHIHHVHCTGPFGTTIKNRFRMTVQIWGKWLIRMENENFQRWHCVSVSFVLPDDETLIFQLSEILFRSITYSPWLS